MRAAVAISPDTLSSVITDAIGEAVDMILVMTVYPGSFARSPPLLRNISFLIDPTGLSCLNPVILSIHPDDNALTPGASSRTGKGGQKFISSCVPKIAQLRERFPTTDIQVDGGIALGESISCCARAGTSLLTVPHAFHILFSFPLYQSFEDASLIMCIVTR